MHAKLPFSCGDSKRELRDAYQMRAELERAELQQQSLQVEKDGKNLKDRVAQGLVPAQNNKSKHLTEEQEQMFKQVLQSSQKNFAGLLNINDDEESSDHHLDDPQPKIDQPDDNGLSSSSNNRY